MADVKAPAPKHTTQDIIFFLLGLLVLGTLIQRVPLFLQGKFGVDVGSPFLIADAVITKDTPLGTEVVVLQDTPYHAHPGEKKEIGTFPVGTALSLVEGPSIFLAERWWRVKNEQQEGGWVVERALVKNNVGGVMASTTRGTLVRSLLTTALWVAPGGGEVSSTMQKGALGSLTEGPRAIVGEDYWWFIHEEGTKNAGWLPQSALVLTSQNNWHTGTRLIAQNTLDLFDKAGGGTSVAVVQEKETVVVTGGPTNIGGAYWWLLTTDAKKEGWAPEQSFVEGGVQGGVSRALTFWLITGTILTCLLLGGIVFVTIRTNQLHAKETQRILSYIPKEKARPKNDRWEKILAHSASDNPNDWRLAILEADILLDELVATMGYVGNTLGERLKQATKGDFKTLDNAWEAHRVRNNIAHTGSGFVLSKREARRILDLYASVFTEFEYI